MSLWPPLHLIGISHRQADLSIRERFSRSRTQIAELLAAARTTGRRAVVLSTCNRFEIYWWGEQDWADWFQEAAGGPERAVPEAALVRKSGPAAARHLFRVAAGLDSQVLGEQEVLGQVRAAWRIAREVRVATAELNLVFAGAVAAGRLVRRETFTGLKPASIGSVAVEFARSGGGGTLAGREVLLLGAGEAARAVARALDGSGAALLVASRRADRAARLAAGHAGLPVAWEHLERALASADIVVTATAAPSAVVSARQLGPILRRRAVPLLLIDLGVPRNVEPGAADLPGLRLVDLDDLRSANGPGSGLLETARELVDDEVSRLLERLRARHTAGRLADLHRLGAVLAEEEAAAALAQLPELGEAERRIVRRMADRLVRRVLYPASRVVRASANGLNGSTRGAEPSGNGR